MPFSIRDLKIRQQILLLTLPPLLVLLCSVALFLYAYWLASHTLRAAELSGESIAQSQILLRDLTEIDMSMRDYLFFRNPSELTNYDMVAARISQDVVKLRDLESSNPSHMDKVEAIQGDIAAWERELSNPTIDSLKTGSTVNLSSFFKESDRRMSALRAVLLVLLKDDQAISVAMTQSAETAMRRALIFGLGVAGLFGVLLLVLTRVVSQMIAQPVRQLIDASDRVSRGDLQPLLPPPVANEFGSLSKSFSNMTVALRRERAELAALNHFSEAVTQCTSEEEVYDHILHSLQDRFHPRQVIIFRLKAEEDFLEAVAAMSPLPEDLRHWPVIEGRHNCKSVRMGRSFLVNDVTLEPLCPSKFVLPREGSYFCGPLIAGGIIIGAVRLEGEANFWTMERQSLLESYLSGAATALSNLRLLQSMKQQANIDPLTGLYNRRFLEEYARKWMAMARRKELPLGFLMMDLDHFKSFNDIYGHEVGDRILRQFAKTITQATRETNLSARFGGEEFVILLPDTDAKSCFMVAERIRKAVEHMTVPSGTEKPLPQITVSIGVATYPEHGEALEEVLQASDKALYESKRAGRNRVSVYVAEAEAAG
jgi:diguanylate cyclase (GGDEF)-like protein